ncbi:TetR/AcrR family transcriptional regulator [Actinomadura violacea]|uniref:TetR/AcrR family transcriptional regulator n=1 Tax=Actinomadura violacea TaxID=2819934 RepID=A0ABS3RHE0_9ACTN|nr:TetR/AcrR family transcriptional regulator [Actinomadura violacea]MBO2456021.1 TetR/AcrR family transcriptional regulator [Actinomadura violacea]
MARWEPNARERLVRAAIDLFAEQGYDATTVTGIAERAGLTKTTFFRHFPDKREVLFAGQELHSRTLGEAVAAAPASATPLQAVAAALDALAATFTDDRRDFAARLLTVIAANDELRERAAFKHDQLAAAIAGALRERGTPGPAAGIAAELGVRAFDAAYARWSDTSVARTLADLAREALDELRSALAALG